MKWLFAGGRVSAIALLVGLLAASVATASHPDILREYRFIPSRSTLVVNGSSSGAFEEVFHARGTFGLVTGYEEGYSCLAIGCPMPPTHVPYAKFVDVDAWLAPEGVLPYLLDLDRTLNLSGLSGTFRNTSPNQLLFQGVDGRGRPFHLEVTMRDWLIRLVGESGPGCCDIDHYSFKALAYRRPHPDLNLDGVVDAGDYVRWRNLLAQAEAGVAADGEDQVGMDFYNLWREHYGEVLDESVFADAALNSSAVPEPATLALALLAAAFGCLRRNR